eukprot:2000931-Lingulodinium_polyedra.AAC.1
MHLQLADASKSLLHDAVECPSVSMRPAMAPLLLLQLIPTDIGSGIGQAQAVTAPQLLPIPS